VIIASGTSNRQTKALASSVRETVKKRGLPVMATEGEDNGEWIIVDCGAAVAHIMQPAIRDYYHLEEIWGGKAVKLKTAEPPARAAAPSDAKVPAKSPAKPSAGRAAKSAVKATRKPIAKTAAKSVGKSADKGSGKGARKSAAKAIAAPAAAGRRAPPRSTKAAAVRKASPRKPAPR
jgi:ribosome-associated protein